MSVCFLRKKFPKQQTNKHTKRKTKKKQNNINDEANSCQAVEGKRLEDDHWLISRMHLG